MFWYEAKISLICYKYPKSECEEELSKAWWKIIYYNFQVFVVLVSNYNLVLSSCWIHQITICQYKYYYIVKTTRKWNKNEGWGVSRAFLLIINCFRSKHKSIEGFAVSWKSINSWSGGRGRDNSKMTAFKSIFRRVLPGLSHYL